VVVVDEPVTEVAVVVEGEEEMVVVKEAVISTGWSGRGIVRG
jgi:hypothetical protein